MTNKAELSQGLDKCPKCYGTGYVLKGAKRERWEPMAKPVDSLVQPVAVPSIATDSAFGERWQFITDHQSRLTFANLPHGDGITENDGNGDGFRTFESREVGGIMSEEQAKYETGTANTTDIKYMKVLPDSGPMTIDGVEYDLVKREPKEEPVPTFQVGDYVRVDYSLGESGPIYYDKEPMHGKYGKVLVVGDTGTVMVEFAERFRRRDGSVSHQRFFEKGTERWCDSLDALVKVD